MARGVNKVFLIGNLGQDPELNYTGSGTAVCNLRVATDESYNNRDGELVERTEWHDVVAWAGLAETIAEHLSKGSQVHIEGSLQTNSWEDRDGNQRYNTEIKARDVKFLSGVAGQNGQQQRGQQQGGGQQQNGRPQRAPERGGQPEPRRRPPAEQRQPARR